MTTSTWSQEELDYALNTILKADSFERMNGLAHVVGKKLQRDTDAVMRILWGLAVRITSVEYEPGPSREQRTDSTSADIQMVIWATRAKTKDKRRIKGPADSEYMAKVLCLPLDVVEELWKMHGPARGRVGFELKTKGME